MKLKIVSLMLATLAPLSLFAAERGEATGNFTLSQETMVPGTTLKPGTYSIEMVDHLQDRYMLRVTNPSGTDHTLFLGVPTKSLPASDASGLVAYASAPDGKSALRGFVFKKGGTSVEFVYPKNDAVALAKLNGNKVLAVDPTSEGKSENLNSLSKDELQMVTLWMLTPEPVSGGEAKIGAAKYERQVASVTPHRPAMASLPHTASMFPAIFLMGIFSAAGATFLLIRRNAAATAA